MAHFKNLVSLRIAMLGKPTVWGYKVSSWLKRIFGSIQLHLSFTKFSGEKKKKFFSYVSIFMFEICTNSQWVINSKQVFHKLFKWKDVPTTELNAIAVNLM